MTHSLSRREALRWMTAGVGAAALPGLGHAAFGADEAGPDSPSAVGMKPRRTLRFAHLTDTHIQPERGGFDGVTACLRHAVSLRERPELVITGGDLVMDAFEASEARTRLQWDLWTRVLRDECPFPIVHTLGNHDIWGWNKSKSGTTGEEAMWGKKWALDALGLARPYQSFDRGAWRIIILDSVFPGDDGYIGRLDDEQRAWLDEELGRVGAGRHAMIVSHIPILSIASVAREAKVEGGRWSMSASVMHEDAPLLLEMFRRRGNVRLCVSGHIHKVDRVDYEGTTFICDGAVSGAWWKGREDRCDEGYGVFDLFEDGSFAHEYLTYGWVAREP